MSVKLKNRRDLPPGGFQYVQAETGWESWNQAPGSDSSFDGCVSAVIAHRDMNPRFKLPTDKATVENEVEQFNALRIQRMPNAESYLLYDSSPPLSFQRPHSQSRLKAAVAGVSKLKAGMSLIEQWEQQGYPAVDSKQSEARAFLCATCPKNELGHFTRWFTVPASEAIMKRADKLREMKLTTPLDEKLGTCSACLCVMAAKVHVPISFIKEHTTAAVKSELDPRCWILAEIAA